MDKRPGTRGQHEGPRPYHPAKQPRQSPTLTNIRRPNGKVLTMPSIPDGAVSLKALVHNMYVTGDRAGALLLIVNGPQSVLDEEFDLINY